MRNMEAETGIKDVVNQYQYDTYRYDYSTNDARYDAAYTPPAIEPAAISSGMSALATEGAESAVPAEPEGTTTHDPASGQSAIAAAGDPSAASTGAERQA